MLDAIVTDFNDFKKNLGRADSQRLDQHLTGIRDLERRIARLEEAPANLASCMKPGRPAEDFDAIEGRPQLSARNRALCDVAVMALACDQTRVVSNFITKPLTNLLLAGATAGHHQLTHDERMSSLRSTRSSCRLWRNWRYFIEALKSIPEVKVHCSTIWCCWRPVTYRTGEPMPWTISPSFSRWSKWQTQTNMHYRSTLAENTSKTMLSIVRAMGINAASFGGQDGEARDGLGAIEA